MTFENFILLAEFLSPGGLIFFLLCFHVHKNIKPLNQLGRQGWGAVVVSSVIWPLGLVAVMTSWRKWAPERLISVIDLYMSLLSVKK